MPDRIMIISFLLEVIDKYEFDPIQSTQPKRVLNGIKDFLDKHSKDELNKDTSINMEDEKPKLKEPIKDTHAEIERLKSKINSVEENDNEEEPFKGKVGTMKVQTAVLLKILNKLGINPNRSLGNKFIMTDLG